MRYKLIAIDMDGTLLNSKDEISERTKMVLSKTIKHGIHIVLATGRIYKSALHYGKYINLNSPIIACNGAVITSNDGNMITYDSAIRKEPLKEIIALAEQNEMYYHFYDIDSFYYKKSKTEFASYYKYYENNFQKQDIKLIDFSNPKDILNYKKDTKFYKIVFIDNDLAKLSDFREKLENIKGINVSKSWYNNLEIMNKGVSKGSGLEYLTRSLNIDSSKVVAIGDNENDISMFKVAGLAIAMENGDETIRKHAHVITDTNDEDGVANAIEKYVFNY